MNDRLQPAVRSTVPHTRAGGGREAAMLRAADPALHGGRREALLIGPGVDDGHVLAAGARPGMAVAAFDGLAGLAAWAAQHDGFDALHVVCHGAPGRLMPGARALDAAALDDAGVQDALAAVGLSLRAGGCVLLYACDVAAGGAGTDFVAALADALGVPVAAATGRVGAPGQGASWALDHATGPLAAAPLAWPDYGHTLTIASTTTTFSGVPAGTNPTYQQLLSGFPTPGVLTQTDVAGSGWDVTARSSNAAAAFQIRGIGASGFGDGDSNAIRFQSSDIDYVDFRSNAGGFYFDLDTFAIRNNSAFTGTVQALDANGQLVGTAVAIGGPGGSSYAHQSVAGNADFQHIYGFRVTFDTTSDAPYFDNLVVANIGVLPTTTVQAASLSADSGTPGDFITNTAAQTVSGSLSAPLASGEKVEVSYDGGAHWSDADAYAAGSSVWSASGTLSSGTGTFEARVTNAAGSTAAYTHAYTLDAAAPAGLALSGNTVTVADASSGAAIGAVSATDATAITYALASGNGTDDADNASFTLSGGTLRVGGAALSAGAYHVYLAATDAAGNVSHLAETITVQSIPSVASIVRTGGAGAGVAAGSTSVDYTVTFSESVTGVDASDFTLVATGTAAGGIAGVSGSGGTYTVTVSGLSGDGTLRLDLNSSGTGIRNGASVAIASGYTAGQAFTLDHTAPSIGGDIALATASDSGASDSDYITNHTSLVVTGSAESGSTVTLYDSDATTVLGTTTAIGGAWSITTSALADGNHTLAATAADAAGNVAWGPANLVVTVDTTAPTGVTLGTTTVAVANATAGAAVGALSATDVNSVTYALAAGNGTNDADNGSFAISGNTLRVGGGALGAGTYHVYLAATDTAGNVSYAAETITIGNAPSVASIVRAGAADVAASAGSVSYTVTFSDNVTGVDAGDFALTATGSAAGSIASVSGSGNTYTVTVNGLAGDGTLRLDLKGSGTGIRDGGGIAIGSGYTAGQAYTLDHTPPSIPGGPDLAAASDSGASDADNVTNLANVVVTGAAESGSTVTLYDTDGTTVLGTTTASGGTWSITTSTLADGAHTLHAQAVDAAGNTAWAPGALAMTVDTAAPAHLALSGTTVTTAGAGAGAAVATLAATDALDVTYALAAGDGANDADNGRFTLSGATLGVGGAPLAAGVYRVYLAATDAAGNVSHLAQTITVLDAPAVTASVRAGGAAADVAAVSPSVDYTVTFSADVTGVDAADFALTATGTAAGHVAGVTGSGGTYTVTVDGLAGDGTLRLDLKGGGTGIASTAGAAIASGFAAGQTYVLDHTAPAAPAAPVLAAASDTGVSHADGITSASGVVVTGTAESGSTVTLYDTDGTTALGTVTATGGAWSIATPALAEGSHTLSAQAVDAAGNVSAASPPLALMVDTTAPADVAPGALSVAVGAAGRAAAVGALSATDASAVTFALTAGDGTNDADNAKFIVDGGTLRVGAAPLVAGTYHIRLSATDAAGNVTSVPRTVAVLSEPAVTSIVRADAPGNGVAADAASVTFIVTFSEAVTGVDAGDFALTASGTATGRLHTVSGSGSTWTVTVDSLAGDGTLRLDLKNAGTGIASDNGVALGAGYTGGPALLLDHTAPSAPSAPALATASDSGIAHDDGITNVAAPTVAGQADAGAVVRLYDTDGVTLLGTTTADGAGHWSIASATLAAGAHTLTARQVDAAGNVSAASAALSVTIDTAAAAPAAPVLAAGSDSGLAGDGITRVAAPTLGGSAEAFATVRLYDTDGVTVLGTATAGADGAWQLTSSALADGAHALTVRQTDVAGNVSAAGPALNLTVDTSAPAAPAAPVLAAGSDTGAQGDGITSIARPVLKGHAEAHATVTLYDGATAIGAATADGNGDWSITAAPLVLGHHHLSATQADAAGNVSVAGASFDLTIVAPPQPEAPAAMIDGVQVDQHAVTLPDGGAGVVTTIPIVTPSRVESTGSAGVADIPLAADGGHTTLLAQVGAGFGLTASGGASLPAGTSAARLVQAIVAATPDHPAGDQAHLAGNGQAFLDLLPAQAPLLVQTVAPVTAAGANGAALTLTGTSAATQHTALVIDAGGVGAGNTLTLQAVDFAAVIGAATVTGNTAGQILTGDAAGQTFVVGAGLGSTVYGGAGDDVMRLASATAVSGAAGAAHADAVAPAATLLHSGLGADTAAFSGNRSDYTIAWHEGHAVVTANGGAHDQALVVNVETLRFADGDVAVQNRASLSAIAGLYASVLGRQADVGGMDFWGSWEKSGATLGQVALGMLGTAEGQGRQGTFNGDAAHDVGVLYQAVFGRAADATGLAYWTEAMHKGATLEQVADQFMHSAEIVGHALSAAQWDFQV